MIQKFKFEDVIKSLYQQEKRIHYQSLTSEKKHTRIVTVPRRFQRSESDKIVVWDVELNTWHDIQVDTIISIGDV